MNTPPGTIAVEGQELERLLSRLLPGVVERTVGDVVERHLRPEPLTFWQHVKVEWTKPAGLIPAMTFFAFAILGGVTAYNAIGANTSANNAQAADLRRHEGTLSEHARLIERVVERMDRADARQRELENSWGEWRRNVDVTVAGQRDDAKEIGRLQTKSGEHDARMSRIFDLLSSNMEKFTLSLNALQRDVAVLRDRQEGGRRTNAPFPKADRQRMVKATATAARPVRVGSRRARRAVAVGLTRSLERAFGRPYYRGRYWASLSRWGRR